jgi:ribonuclease-3
MLYRDFKTELQEFLQAQKEVEIRYLVDREEGPDHNKTFYVSLWDGEKKLGEGSGKTKKEAEQNAARAALEGYGVVF